MDADISSGRGINDIQRGDEQNASRKESVHMRPESRTDHAHSGTNTGASAASTTLEAETAGDEATSTAAVKPNKEVATNEENEVNWTFKMSSDCPAGAFDFISSDSLQICFSKAAYLLSCIQLTRLSVLL